MIHQEIAFFKFDQLIIFLHISFVALFIGLQAGLVLTGSYFIKNKFEDKERYHILLHIIRRFGLAIFALVLGIALTSLIMIFYFDDGKMQNPMTSAIVATKWAIELFLLLNLSYIFYRYKGFKNPKIARDDRAKRKPNRNHLLLHASKFTSLACGCLSWREL